MKRTVIASLGITLALATLAAPVLAQSTSRAGFGPPPSAVMQDPGIATPAAPDAQVVAPPATASEPVVVEQSPAVIEPAPVAREEAADAYAPTRRAAPDPEPPRDRRNPNPQTGHYLGHGLFNNWGPNDFGA